MIEFLVGFTVPGRDKSWAWHTRGRADKYMLAGMLRVLGLHLAFRIIWRT